MSILKFLYSSNLKKLYLLILLIFILIVSVYYGQGRKLDGNTYVVTGARFLNHDLANLYGETGSARFGYQPQVSAFYGLFVVLGDPAAYPLWIAFNGLCVWLTYLLFSNYLAKSKMELNLLLALSAVAYWFIIDESLYIGQMDLILVFCISAYIFLFEKYSFIAGFLLGFIVQFKPHLTLLALPLVFHPNFLLLNMYRKWIKKDKDAILFTQNNRVLIWSGITIVISILFFIRFSRIGFSEYLKLFKLFEDATGNYAFVSCCTSVNNSLRAILFNLFSEMSQAGRWFPYAYADIPGTHNIRIYPVKNISYLYAVYIALVFSAASYLIYTLIKSNLNKMNKHPDKILFFTCLSSLGTLSPAYWHTHMIYTLPVMYYFSVSIIHQKYEYKNILYNFIFILIFIILSVNNYYIIGNYWSDVTLLIGVYYSITLILFLIFTFESRNTDPGKVVKFRS